MSLLMLLLTVVCSNVLQQHIFHYLLQQHICYYYVSPQCFALFGGICPSLAPRVGVSFDAL